MTDYRDLHRKGEPKANRPRTGAVADRQWWEYTGNKCADSIKGTVDFLQKNQQPRIRQAVISSRLYGNIALSGAAGASYTRLLQSQTAVKDRITYNAIQSIIDTVTARVGETKPRPYFLTSGGNYQQQRKAKKLNQWVEGVFYETKTYDLGIKSFRDAAIWGDGLMHVFARGGKVCHERVMSSELWVDEVEAQYGFPRNMHRVKVVDRDELAGYFPEHRKDIMDAMRSTDTTGTVSTNISDMVTVCESWHLGYLNEDGECVGGKHSIALISNSKMLVEPEEWPHNFFPFAKIPWCERPVGYWSQGLCEQLQGEQMELNKELWFIQRSMHMAGTVKVLLKNGSKVVKENINNEVGAIITYAGDAPTFFCPEPIHPVYFENVNRIIERMSQQAGVSQLSSGGKKPAGLNSGAAQREYEDIQAERFRVIQRQNDNFYLAIAALDVCIGKELKNVTVRAPGKNSFTEINLKDIGSLKDSEFVMQCFPVSRLPRDPSGRLSTIQEYIQAGMITPRQGRRALDFADLDSVESLANAQEDIITKTLDDIIDEGIPGTPEPTDDLEMAKEMAIEYIQRYRLMGLENEKLELLRNYRSQVGTLEQKALAQTMPAPGQGVPQAAPMPQAQSELVQNAPGIQAAA